MLQRLNRDLLFVLLSLLVQVPLAVFLGHFYDDRVFMATGYLVSSGLNPYAPFNFAGVFPTEIISEIIPRIGYPPPYPLMLGLIYRVTYAMNQDVFLYNFAIKIPAIIANIGLAFLVRYILADNRVSNKTAQTAFLLVLFNPFILLTTTAWGQFDTLVAAISIAALCLASKGKVAQGGLLMGFAVALKPIALPLAALPLLYSSATVARKNKFLYAALFSVTFAACFFGPFLVAGWNIPLFPGEWNAQFQMAGGMTFFNVLGLFQSQVTLPAEWSFLGYLWIPALLACYYVVYLRRPSSLASMFNMAVLSVLVFFLSRTWVSEPNINMLLPLLLVAASLKAAKFRVFHIAWIIPLIFMFPNYAFPQLFFLVDPSIMTSLTLLNAQIGTIRVLAQFLVAVVWMVFALKLTAQMLRQPARALPPEPNAVKKS
jgi:hypothetical protein